MFTINDDLSIYVTRGDMAFFNVSAEEDGKPYTFKEGDIVRIKVTEKKACENVMFQKDFPVTVPTENVSILLTEEDTKIGDVISKPTDYWYEIELNPYSNPQTIIGYDEEGAKIFKLFPEGKDIGTDTKEEDIPVVDSELDATSQRPVENQAITRGMIALENKLREEFEEAVQQRINELESIDQSYNPESISAQSGKAVSQAINTVHTTLENYVKTETLKNYAKTESKEGTTINIDVGNNTCALVRVWTTSYQHAVYLISVSPNGNCCIDKLVDNTFFDVAQDYYKKIVISGNGSETIFAKILYF